MTDKQELILSLRSLSKEGIAGFISTFGPSIQELIVINQGNEELYKKVIIDLLSEINYRLNNSISFDNYDIDTYIYSLAILVLKWNIKTKDKKAAPLILKQNYYELTGMKLYSQSVLKKEALCEETVNSMGEPGRTILRLSFFDKKSDKDIAKHLHFESEEQVKKRRLKLLDRCIQILENDGRG